MLAVWNAQSTPPALFMSSKGSSLPTSGGMASKFRASSSAAASAPPASHTMPPSANQLEDLPLDDQPIVPPKPLVAKPADYKESKHYYSWAVSVQERTKSDGSVQTELHTYMSRPPNAPEHVAQLALSVVNSAVVRSTNVFGRQWSATNQCFQPLPPIAPDPMQLGDP